MPLNKAQLVAFSVQHGAESSARPAWSSPANRRLGERRISLQVNIWNAGDELMVLRTLIAAPWLLRSLDRKRRREYFGSFTSVKTPAPSFCLLKQESPSTFSSEGSFRKIVGATRHR